MFRQGIDGDKNEEDFNLSVQSVNIQLCLHPVNTE